MSDYLLNPNKSRGLKMVEKSRALLEQNNLEKQNSYQAYPYERPGPQKNDNRKTDVPLDVKLRPFNMACYAVPDLKIVDWTDIKAVSISETGSGGVIFVETSVGAAVVKGVSDCAMQFFLFRLCKIIGVPIPDTRIIRWTDPEFNELIKNLQKATFSDQALSLRIRPRIDMAYLTIMEYIPGISIVGMGTQRANAIFDHLNPDSRDRLIRLGMIFSFDIFINNSDRFPFLWDNEGNPENLLVKAQCQYTSQTEDLKDPNNLEMDFQNFYAVDSKMTNTNTSTEVGVKNFNQYVGRVEHFLNGLFMELQQVIDAQIDPIYESAGKLQSLQQIMQFIHDYTLYGLKEMQTLQVMIGLVVGIHNIVDLGIERIGEIKQFLRIDPKDDWMNYWNENIEQVNLNILKDLIAVFTQFLTVYPEVIRWAREITLNQYSLNLDEYQRALGREPAPKAELDNPEENNQPLEEEQNDPIENNNPAPEEEDDGADPLAKQIRMLFGLDIDGLQQDLQDGQSIDQYNVDNQKEQFLKSNLHKNQNIPAPEEVNVMVQQAKLANSVYVPDNQSRVGGGGVQEKQDQKKQTITDSQVPDQANNNSQVTQSQILSPKQQTELKSSKSIKPEDDKQKQITESNVLSPKPSEPQTNSEKALNNSRTDQSKEQQQ